MLSLGASFGITQSDDVTHSEMSGTSLKRRSFRTLLRKGSKKESVCEENLVYVEEESLTWSEKFVSEYADGRCLGKYSIIESDAIVPEHAECVPAGFPELPQRISI
ncbi:hypothetical protein AVEN_59938-1 [Araneus ventricosus]|uniref:Uncharacterized protein n=1 Tax=Araneus ventricosus TaxID=182803 RepID=A0A4Y2SIW8_ARAVE|nr:hypothetical protein AVEN_59938-1 [Araneus ventricosus]